MRQAILIRVKPENFERWFAAHSGAKEARRAYGITDGPLYRDADDPGVALVHLDVDDLDRSMQWFQSEAFKEGVRQAGRVQREFWIARARE